jgi:hypothetical protein
MVMRPWLPIALTAAALLVLESSVGIWPSDRFGNVATRAIGGWAGLAALGLIWSAGIVFSLGRSLVAREPPWAVGAVVSSIIGFVYFPDWAQRVALPTHGGISPHELLEGMFPFVGQRALYGFTVASLPVLVLVAFARARMRPARVTANATGVAPPRG